MFEQLESVPGDPILGLSARCREDPNPDKIDLTVGVYKNEAGITPVFEAVRLAQQALADGEHTKAYIQQAGDPVFNEEIPRLLLGADNALLTEGRVASIQTPGGCGGLRIGAELIRLTGDGAKVWVSKPTWANHIPLIGSVGLGFEEYRYYNPESHGVDIEGMLADLGKARAGDVVLLHACCHNPCGADLSQEQWEAVGAVCEKNGLLPFLDIAYQGMADGLEEDAWGVRHLAGRLPEVVVALSCSKTMGLYRERTGATVLVGQNPETTGIMLGQAMLAARRIYSMPPAHGGIIAGRILSDEQLGKVWRDELADMRGRLNRLRGMLDERLSAATGRDFGFIRREKGMFSFLGLGKDQVDRLREEYSIYMVGSSRVNVAGVNDANMDYLANSIKAVI